jgi:hypothetical protein
MPQHEAILCAYTREILFSNGLISKLLCGAWRGATG